MVTGTASYGLGNPIPIRKKVKAKFIDELLALPRGKYDDMVDGFCTGLNGLQQVGEPKITWLHDEDEDDGEDI